MYSLKLLTVPSLSFFFYVLHVYSTLLEFILQPLLPLYTSTYFNSNYSIISLLPMAYGCDTCFIYLYAFTSLLIYLSALLHLYASKPPCLYDSMYLRFYASTPLPVYSSMLLGLHVSTSLRLYASTPLCLYPSTPLRLQASTPPHFYISTYLHLFCHCIVK